MMARINLLLLLAVMASALYLVRLQYTSRALYGQIDRAMLSERKLETERDTLEVQKRAQAAALRVDRAARTQLAMREASPAITQYVRVHSGIIDERQAPAAAPPQPEEGRP